MTPDGKYGSAQNNEEQQKCYLHRKIQACLRDIVGSVPDHHNKANNAIKLVT